MSTNEDRPVFGRRLRELREQAGLTQKELADRAGLHLSAITRFEQGIREPTWSTVRSLGQVLGVSCEAFNQEPGPLPEAKRGRPAKPKPETPAEPKKRGRPRKDAS